MTRHCYFHPTPLVTAGGKTACPQCGTAYLTLPAVGPFCSAPAATPRRAPSSLPAGAFLPHIPAQGGGGPFGDGGQPMGATRLRGPMQMADRSSGGISVTRQFVERSAWCAGTASAESAEGRLLGSQGVEGPYQNTSSGGGSPSDAAPGWADRHIPPGGSSLARHPFPPLAPQRDLDRELAMPTPGNWLGGIALFAGLIAFAFIGFGLQ